MTSAPPDDRALLKLAALVLGAGRRAGEPVTVALVELCGEDALVAAHGRGVVDELRRHVATQIAAALRGEDVVTPLARGLLLALLPGASAITAGVALQRAHARVAAHPFVSPAGLAIPVAIAIGAAAVGARGQHGDRDGGPGRPASVSWGDRTGPEALAAAEDALVQARHDGRSPYVVHAEQSTGDLPTIDPFEPLLASTFADGYRLLHPISSGAVGVVYRAEDLGLARPVAIKILRHELARNHQWVMRFRQEAAILASLRHPNIVQAYACGEHDGTSYLVMELVEGASVKDMIERSARDARPIPLEVVTAVLTQIASALDALHAAGIVHRDVKPANILMDPFRDRAVLVDVGIAQRRGADRQAAGTLGYMAPEVIEHGRYDARADVFGLAVTGFEMILGRSPWPASRTPLELLTRLVSEPPLRPSELDPAWAPLDAPMAAALAIDPAGRIACAGELATRFAAALAAVGDRPGPSSRRSGQHAAVAAGPEVRVVTTTGGEPPLTRAAVFRQLAGVVAARELAALRDGADELAAALAADAPLAWFPTAALVEILRRLRPDPAERAALAQSLGRAVVRTSFRRLFPASGATLAPSGTLSALPNIWAQYHTWGAIATALPGHAPGVITVTGTLREPDLCALATGMFEQLILLSGGTDAVVRHPVCEAHGGSACEFETVWQLRPFDRALGGDARRAD